MNFAALKQELADRGFDYLSDTRLGSFINGARAHLDEIECWPFREKYLEGAAPLEIADLGLIEVVADPTNNTVLKSVEFEYLLRTYGDMSLSGAPMYYYIAWPAAVPVVATYPVSTGDIGVQYWKTTPDLSASSDTPVAPSRFHEIIVDMAAQRAYRDSDNFDAAAALESVVQARINDMKHALLPSRMDYIQQVEGW